MNLYLLPKEMTLFEEEEKAEIDWLREFALHCQHLQK